MTIKHLFSCFLLFIFSTQFFFGQQLTNEIREQIIIDYAADVYKVPVPNYTDPEKVYWPVTIARLTKYGSDDSLANTYIQNEVFVNKAPFHFILVGMARLMPLFPNAPAMEKYKLEYLKNVYNVKDSYNPWTGEGTENHVNMNRTSGYIFAEMMEDYPEIFPEAPAYKTLMKEWISWYSKTVYACGTAEFNASTYGVYNVIGWLNIYDFARDEEVRSMAKAVLDYFAAEIALHYSYGITGGSESRGAPALNKRMADTDYLGWLWFGGADFPVRESIYNRPANKGPLQTVHAATSNYRPHPLMKSLALKINAKPAFYTNSKPSYGLKHSSFIKQHFYISDNYTMGSAFYPYGAFTTAAYKNTTWKLVSRANGNDFPEIITGGGMFYDDLKGMIRNPWLQVAQHRNVLVQMNMMPENALQIYAQMQDTIAIWGERWERDFIARFGNDDVKITNKDLFPVKAMKNGSVSPNGNGSYITFSSFKHVEVRDSVLFAETDNLFIYILAIGGNLTEFEQYSFITQATLGKLSGQVLEAFEKDSFKNFASFVAQISASQKYERLSANEILYFSSGGDQLRVKYASKGTFIEPIYDWGYGPVEPQLYLTSPPYQQPEWPDEMGYGRVADWWVNNTPVNLTKKWPVYSGPGLYVNEGLMVLENNEEKYIVDYSAELPQFTYQPALADTVVFLGDNIQMKIKPWGGNIVTLENNHKNSINPLTWHLNPEQMPPNNKGGAPFEGHFLCTGRWGAPTEGEIQMGVPHNGQASNSLWKITAHSDTLLTIQISAPVDNLKIIRSFSKGVSPGSIRVIESFNSVSSMLRVNNIVQHVTLGPPFLNEETLILTNAKDGFLQSHSWPDPERYAYTWPLAIDSSGNSFDLRRPNMERNYVSTHIFKDSLGWVSAYDPHSGNLLLYTWKVNEYPWINIWNAHNNMELKALGLEFGTTGIGRSYNELLFNPQSIFKGKYSYNVLDAGETITKNYTVHYNFIGKGKDESQVITEINKKIHLH